jgi:hypothetical protein
MSRDVSAPQLAERWRIGKRYQEANEPDFHNHRLDLADLQWESSEADSRHDQLELTDRHIEPPLVLAQGEQQIRTYAIRHEVTQLHEANSSCPTFAKENGSIKFRRANTTNLSCSHKRLRNLFQKPEIAQSSREHTVVAQPNAHNAL